MNKIIYQAHLVWEQLKGDRNANTLVPDRGLSVWLVHFTAGIVAILLILALSIFVSSGRISSQWSDEIERSATLRIPISEQDGVERAKKILETTPEVLGFEDVSEDKQLELLKPWFGIDVPVEDLPLPHLIAIEESKNGVDGASLQLRLDAEIPGAVYDDHSRWRDVLITAANRVQLIGFILFTLISGLGAALMIMTAWAALTANHAELTLMRLVGAYDRFLIATFVRRFTIRTLFGAIIGTLLATFLVALLGGAVEGLGSKLGFSGWEWLYILIAPLVLAILAFATTNIAAKHYLKRLS